MKELEVQRYEESVGKPPERLPDDHPYAWQWKYRGTKAEREALLGTFLPEVETEVPQVIDGQEALL